MTPTHKALTSDHAGMCDLLAQFKNVRAASDALAAPLSAEDCTIQSMPDASPVKWHLAHTTWFFETIVLGTLGIPPFDPSYAYLFNSYYEALGPRQPRLYRGQHLVLAGRRGALARACRVHRWNPEFRLQSRRRCHNHIHGPDADHYRRLFCHTAGRGGRLLHSGRRRLSVCDRGYKTPDTPRASSLKS